MKPKTYLLFLVTLTVFQSCKAQELSTNLPSVENHLIGDIDYTVEPLQLIQNLANGKEISLGNITKAGVIHFKLPEYDIKALFDSINLEHYRLQSWFSIDSGCKDRDVFADTPFDDVYSQKTNAIYIKKYGIKVAILEAASEKDRLRNHTNSKDSLAVFSTFHWFYMDRAINYKDECSKISPSTKELYATINANLPFDKGWNFIEEKTTMALDYDQSDPNSIQLKKTYFTKTSPASKNVKWTLRQVANDDKIGTAKRLFNLTPITKEKFEKWAPEKLSDLKVSFSEYGNPPQGLNNKNNIHLTYTNEIEKKEIDLYIVDCAKNPDDMEMINFAYAMENNGKDEKDIKPYITQYNDQENATQLLYKVEDRILVNASGVNINAEDLWAYIQKLEVGKLLK